MDVDEATPSQIVESSMSLSGTSELVAFTVDPSDEELFISFKFGSKIGAGREYVVFRCAKQSDAERQHATDDHDLRASSSRKWEFSLSKDDIVTN